MAMKEGTLTCPDGIKVFIAPLSEPEYAVAVLAKKDGGTS